MIDFVMRIEHIGFVEAVERLADRIGVPAHLHRRRQRRCSATAAPGPGCWRRTRRPPSSTPRALRTPEAAPAVRVPHLPRLRRRRRRSSFGCGFAPAGWDALTKHLLAAGFTLDELMKAGPDQGGQPRPDRPVPPPPAVADPGPRRRRRRLRRPPDLRRRPRSRPSTSTPPRRRSTARRTCCSGWTWPSGRSPSAARSSSSRATPTSWRCTSPACPPRVASCGTAFGAEHVSVIRRLIGDDSFDRGEVIYTFDGDAAGQAAALKAFDGEQSFAAQTFVAIAPDGQDPCDLRLSARRHRRARPRGPPRADLRVRDPLDPARLRPRHRRGPGRGPAALRPARRPDQARGAARRVRAPARGLDELGRHRDGRPAGARERPARPPTGRVVRARPRRSRPATTRACTASARCSSPRCRCPRSPGPAYDELPEQAFTHPATSQVHRAVQAAGGVCGGREGSAWLDAVVAECTPEDAAGWSASWPSSRWSCRRKNTDEVRYVASIVAGVRLALVDEQIAEIKSRLQRTNPVADADAYLELFGDLVPLEQYRIALREKAMGAVGMSVTSGMRCAASRRRRAARRLRRAASSRTSGCSRRRGRRTARISSSPPGGCGCPTATGSGALGWHLVSRATWKNGALAVVEATEVEEIARRRAAVLLADRPARRFRLADAGPGSRGRARPGRGLDPQPPPPGPARRRRLVRAAQGPGPRRHGAAGAAGPGTDPAVVAQVAADVARSLRRP